MKYANERRNMGEFKEAEIVYRKVLQACTEEHEARWGLLLCKYGVIYVEGSDNYRRMITCRIAQNSLFCAEPDYQIVLSQAPTEVRAAYESDGKYIDDVQRAIQTLRPTIEKYDVFLCYKETSSEGGKTRDSDIARDIYHQMSQKGYRVFYAPESLKEKAGANYEAIIFLAIESSRAMLVIGTQKEFFNSIYVRSEWKRFKEQKNSDRSEEKKLIPLFLNKEDLPDEIKPYQGFNITSPYMERIYSILRQDIPDDQKIKLVKNYIKKGIFQDAEATLNDLLKEQPQNAELWLLKAMADLRTRKETDLVKPGKKLIENNAFLSAIRFSTGSLQEQLLNYQNTVIKRLEEEEERKRLKKIMVTIISILAVIAVIVIGLLYWNSTMYASVNIGDHNTYAGKLQEHLFRYGYYSSNTKRELNTYDQATKQAVIRFCEQHDLSYSGGTVSKELYKFILTNTVPYGTPTPLPTATPLATPSPAPKPTPIVTKKPTAKPTATTKPTAKPTATTKPTAKPTASTTYFSVYTTSLAKIRSSPSKDGPLVATVETGTVLDAIEQVPSKDKNGKNWYKIKYNGAIAYVSSTMASQSKPKTTSATTPKTTSATTPGYTDWTVSRGWSPERRAISNPELEKEETATIYGWYYFECSACHAHNVYSTYCKTCGAQNTGQWHAKWSTEPWSLGTSDGVKRYYNGYWIWTNGGEATTGYRYWKREKKIQ